MKEQSIDDLITPLEEYQKKDIVVSSMRLDTIIASALTISRQKSKQLVESGAVQVNYAVVEKQDFDIQTSDLISVRKYGRFRVEENLGNTKKDKIRLTLTTILAK